MAFLTRIDPTRNINRFYVVQVMPSLFGEWTVLREWGRRGSPGTVRLDSYGRRNEAETAERRTIKRRLQRGYFQSRRGRDRLPGAIGTSRLRMAVGELRD
jgi:predicted DNA-binding WGR domain protein